MPSPSIPRSQSAPRISGAPPSPSSSDVLPAPSIRSLHSDNSPRTYWPKKLGEFISRKGSSSSKNPKLTEESLQEFNRLNAIVEEKRCLSYSPYYKGLTDSSLVTNQQRSSLPSPDRESHAPSFFSSSSKASFVVKMQEWGSSCFVSPQGKEEKSSQSSSRKSTKSSLDTWTQTSSSTPSSSSSSRRKAVDRAIIKETAKMSVKQPSSEKKEARHGARKTTDVPFALLYKGKPLRERVSQPPSPPPTPPHPPLLTMLSRRKRQAQRKMRENTSGLTAIDHLN